MANYSKWDKFAAQLSDSDNEEEENRPLVTTLDGKGGKSIEIGPNGYKVKDDSAVENVFSKGTVETLSTSTNVGDNQIALESKNGAVCDGYSWAQDRYEVLLSIVIDESVKAKDIRVTYSDNLLEIRKVQRKDAALFSGTLRYDIMTNAERKDDEVSDVIDWEIKNKVGGSSSTATTRRVLEAVLRKKSPIPGAFIWWKNICVTDKYEIDVTKISGRSSSAVEAASSTEDNFAIAHKQFLEKVGQMERIPVDVDEGAEDIDSDEEGGQ